MGRGASLAPSLFPTQAGGWGSLLALFITHPARANTPQGDPVPGRMHRQILPPTPVHLSPNQIITKRDSCETNSSKLSVQKGRGRRITGTACVRGAARALRQHVLREPLCTGTRGSF